ncbi:MAG TPA: nucleotide exchange factor GrpE [Campylobacterales bacterium]|nr:nucleotide exchange factor GrpE [Campylobacterales bacterium]
MLKENEDKEIESEEVDENLEIEVEEEVELSPIEVLEEKVAELEDLRLRDLAEFENIKKRLEKEKMQSIAYAQESFAGDLLAVIDSLDNANATMDNLEEVNAEKIKEGIDLTVDQFKKIFEKHGIELVDVENGFDPNFHEAVMKVDSPEHSEGEVVQVLQKGYKIKDRLLRSAMVSIAK